MQIRNPPILRPAGKGMPLESRGLALFFRAPFGGELLLTLFLPNTYCISRLLPIGFVSHLSARAGVAAQGRRPCDQGKLASFGAMSSQSPWPAGPRPIGFVWRDRPHRSRRRNCANWLRFARFVPTPAHGRAGANWVRFARIAATEALITRYRNQKSYVSRRDAGTQGLEWVRSCCSLFTVQSLRMLNSSFAIIRISGRAVKDYLGRISSGRVGFAPPIFSTSQISLIYPDPLCSSSAAPVLSRLGRTVVSAPGVSK